MSEPRDYTEDIEEEHVGYLIPWVFKYMLEEMARTNFRHSWMLDPTHGLQEIAYFAAEYLPSFPYEQELVSKHLGRPADGSELDPMAKQARGYMNAIYCTVTTLIDGGQLEFEMSMRWPCLRLTRAALDFDRSMMSEGIRRHRDRIDELRKMPYREYLQSDEWKYRREQHIEAAGERCQLCNSEEKPLHVHHRTYENRGRENFYDLVALCGPCHEWFHKSGRKVR